MGRAGVSATFVMLQRINKSGCDDGKHCVGLAIQFILEEADSYQIVALQWFTEVAFSDRSGQQEDPAPGLLGVAPGVVYANTGA